MLVSCAATSKVWTVSFYVYFALNEKGTNSFLPELYTITRYLDRKSYIVLQYDTFMDKSSQYKG